jgi:anti-anti-sigma regulatory factor
VLCPGTWITDGTRMSPDATLPEPPGREPFVEVDRLADGAPFSAIVRLHGGHDVATSRHLRDALRSAEGDVLLDLSTCEFIDSSVIFVIFADCNARARDGRRLDLLVPPSNRAIARTLEIAGAREVLGVLAELPGAS